MREDRRLFHLTVALAGMWCALVACHQSEHVPVARDPVLNPSDQTFISEAEQLVDRDSALSTFVEGQSRSAEIKKYADTVTADDSAALQKLQNAINKYKLNESSAASGQQTTAAQLKGLSSRALDRKFVSLIIQDDETAIGIFQKETESPGDADLRQYAVATLPALQNELKTAQELQTKVSPAATKKVRTNRKRRL